MVKDEASKRAKHRVMTLAEYREWRLAGDTVSSSHEPNPFSGGLTILTANGAYEQVIDPVAVGGVTWRFASDD